MLVTSEAPNGTPAAPHLERTTVLLLQRNLSITPSRVRAGPRTCPTNNRGSEATGSPIFAGFSGLVRPTKHNRENLHTANLSQCEMFLLLSQ